MDLLLCACGNYIQKDYSLASTVNQDGIDYYVFKDSECGELNLEPIKSRILTGVETVARESLNKISEQAALDLAAQVNAGYVSPPQDPIQDPNPIVIGGGG